MSRGQLVAFEGLDGCGKSTQVARLAERLAARGTDTLVTHEPTDGPIGQRIRRMADSGETVPPEEELRWFVEDRREHVRDLIEPALAAGRVVITDRYYLSSVCYQGARGLDPARILEQSEAEFPIPDLVLLLEIEPALGLERVRARGRALEGAFERADFLERVAELFQALDLPYLERIDAARPEGEVGAAVEAALRSRLSPL